jgi:hypothetical protein
MAQPPGRPPVSNAVGSGHTEVPGVTFGLFADPQGHIVGVAAQT